MDTPTEAELAALRAELAEARADVQRFEAQLDATNRELAQARAERDEAVRRRDFAKEGEDNMRYLKQLWEQECGYYRASWWEAVQANDRSRRAIAALVVAARAMCDEGEKLIGWRQFVSAVGETIRYGKAKQAGEG